MKALYVRKLFLWPRFQAQVKDTLNELPIEVSGIYIAHFCLGKQANCLLRRLAWKQGHTLRNRAKIQQETGAGLAQLENTSGLIEEVMCAQVIELAQEMTPPMVAIYDSIADLLDVCIKHLRRSNKIDTSDFSLESCLFRSFDEIVRRQLDSVWHTITPQTKQVSGSHSCTPESWFVIYP